MLATRNYRIYRLLYIYYIASYPYEYEAIQDPKLSRGDFGTGEIRWLFPGYLYWDNLLLFKASTSLNRYIMF